jgi:hypothetical protein
MDVAGAAVVWTPYQARPGRRVLVVKDLADLRGPASGTVTLPLRLFWSPPGRVFDLDDPFMLRSMYQIVLGEAIRAEELTTYLNRDRLVAVWRDLYLPKGVRRAWEELHPALHATALRATRGADRGPKPPGTTGFICRLSCGNRERTRTRFGAYLCDTLPSAGHPARTHGVLIADGG